MTAEVGNGPVVEGDTFTAVAYDGSRAEVDCDLVVLAPAVSERGSVAVFALKGTSTRPVRLGDWLLGEQSK